MSEDSGDVYKAISKFEATIDGWPMFLFRFKTFLEGKDLVKYIETSDIELTMPSSTTDDNILKKRKEDAKVRGFLVNKLNVDSLNIVRDCRTSYEMGVSSGLRRQHRFYPGWIDYWIWSTNQTPRSGPIWER